MPKRSFGREQVLRRLRAYEKEEIFHVAWRIGGGDIIVTYVGVLFSNPIRFIPDTVTRFVLVDHWDMVVLQAWPGAKLRRCFGRRSFSLFSP